MSIEERFHNFHQQNPDVLDKLIGLARDAKRRGYRRYSLKALWEVLRFSVDPTSAEKYKLSNDFTSRYARLVMHHAPDLAGFFVTKSLKDEGSSQCEAEDDDELDRIVNGYD